MVVLRTIAGTAIAGAVISTVLAGGISFIFSLGYLWLRLTGRGYDDYTYCLITGCQILLLSLPVIFLILFGYQCGNDLFKRNEEKP